MPERTDTKIFFLHGLGQTRQSWEETIKNLHAIPAEYPEVISPKAKNQTFSSLTKCLEDKILQEKEPVIICGISLGAVLALDLYFKHTDNISGLILIAPQFKMPTKLIDLQNWIFRFLPKQIFTKIGLTKKEMISISSSLRKIDFSSKIKSVKCPVYIVCGDQDKANKIAAISLQALLPHGKLFLLAGAAHQVNVDQPQALAKIVQQAYAEIAQTKNE